MNRRHNGRYLLAALIITATSGFSISPAFAQATRPAGASPLNAAATQPETRVAADYSDPKKALASFLQANDEKSIREALIIPPQASAEVEAYLGVTTSSLALQKEARAQFGPAAAQYFSKATDAQIARRLKALADAPVNVKSPDAASIALPADEESKLAAGIIELRRIEGQWRVDAISAFGAVGQDHPAAARRIALARALRDVTLEMIKDMPKFLSAGDAYQEWSNRSRDALLRITANGAPGPATRP